MANADTREFYFYPQYLWTPTDFQNMQNWERDNMRAVAEGAFGAAVLQGLEATAGGGLVVNAAAGIAVNSSGRPLVSTGGNGTFASPVGNPAWSLLVLRPKDTDMNDINEPLNPTNQVPLHKQTSCEFIVINGTPAASPAYPSIVAGDVIIMGVKLNAGHTTITVNDFDFSVRNIPRRRTLQIEKYTGAGNINATSDNEVLEVDCTSANKVVILPTAQSAYGRKLTLVKVDSSANTLAASGQGGDLLSGQSSQEIEDQWGFINLYSNGLAWRLC